MFLTSCRTKIKRPEAHSVPALSKTKPQLMFFFEFLEVNNNKLFLTSPYYRSKPLSKELLSKYKSNLFKMQMKRQIKLFLRTKKARIVYFWHEKAKKSALF